MSARIALLGRDGDARDQLAQAVAALGAEVAVAGDPAELTPEDVRALNPSVLVVSLDAAMESELDRWESLLDDPSINVLFDEAEVTRRLAGWDLARWARHLASKIVPSSSLLPPAPVDAEPLPVAAGISPRDRGEAPVARPVASLDVPDDSGLDVETVDFDPPTFEAVLAADGDDASEPGSSPPVDEYLDTDDFCLDADLAALDAAIAGGAAAPEPGEGGEQAMDDELAALLAQFDEASPDATGIDAEETGGTPGEVRREEASPADPVPVEETPVSSPFAGLELVPMEDAAYRPPSAPSGSVSIDDLIVGLGLVEHPDAADGEIAGAIVLVAGMGGPDAVRQCLGALPAQLPVPVIVWQHLDTANHDRLVPQMARASQVPVYLATAGQDVRRGQAAILPADTGVDFSEPASLRYASEGASAVDGVRGLAGLGRDAVLIVLSGADPEIVGPARDLLAQGGLVLAQDPATCFDCKAATALHQAGAAIAAPAELAQRALRHWSE